MTDYIIKAIIVDDASQARELLRMMIHELAKNVTIVGEAENLSKGIELVKSKKPDVVFLDIEMPGKSGLQIVEELSGEEIDYEIIFTTAYNQYALQAFRLSAIDYLLKPIREKELIEAISKISQRKSDKQSALRLKALMDNFEVNNSNVICIPFNHGYEYLPVNDIEYIEADGSYAHVYLKDGKKKTISKNLKYFEDTLAHFPYFVKSHRSVIINLNFMASFNKSDRGIITLRSGKQTNLSRSCRAYFLKTLEERNL